jgi:hypothetical protein
MPNEQEKRLKMQAKVTGDGKHLVLVPGGLTGWLGWEPHAERLSKTRKVIRVQLLNVQYGFENRRLPPRYSVKTESHALASTLDEFKEVQQWISRLGLMEHLSLSTLHSTILTAFVP